ncbi:MAG: (2Fe-2S)-binding protein [Lawsonibacter sp.]|nr:(2Fe-2S)-binding protein [Lawsonibacter sp.]
MIVHFILNNQPVSRDLPPDRRLIDVLREDFLLTGAKESCGEGECGACTILLDGRAVHACLVLAGQLEGHEVLTIEGLAQNDELDIIQNAFVEHVAIQCGFCTPGMIMSTKGLLLQNPSPTDEEIRVALSGNICRCSGYVQIIAAVRDAAKKLREVARA